MSLGERWVPIRKTPVNVDRCYVQRGEQLGFPKYESKQFEKLASELAQLISVPVPRVEIGFVDIMNEEAAISFVHSEQSRPLRKDGDQNQTYSHLEMLALRAASGLIPFFVWLGSDDHRKDSNLVVEDLGGDVIRIVAVDFEHAFPWKTGATPVKKVDAILSPGLAAHHDRGVIKATLEKIERLADTEIFDCCVSSGLAAELASSISSGLLCRRGLLRNALDIWLPS